MLRRSLLLHTVFGLPELLTLFRLLIGQHSFRVSIMSPACWSGVLLTAPKSVVGYFGVNINNFLCPIWKKCHNTHRQLLESDISAFPCSCRYLCPTSAALWPLCPDWCGTLRLLATGDVDTSWMAGKTSVMPWALKLASANNCVCKWHHQPAWGELRQTILFCCTFPCNRFMTSATDSLDRKLSVYEPLATSWQCFINVTFKWNILPYKTYQSGEQVTTWTEILFLFCTGTPVLVT